MEASRHDMLQEAADELVSGARHDLGFAVLPIVLPGEPDLAIVEAEQTAVGDSNAVRVAAEIAEHLLRTREWGFGEDDPVVLGRCVDPGGKAGGAHQGGEGAGEAELTIGERGTQLLDEQVAEAAGEHADGQEEAGRACDPACLVG